MYILSADHGRVLCDVNGYINEVVCHSDRKLPRVKRTEKCTVWSSDYAYLWQNSRGNWESQQGMCAGDPLQAMTDDPPELPVGTTVTAGDVAVMATDDGVLVWSGVAGHGFQFSGRTVRTW